MPQQCSPKCKDAATDKVGQASCLSQAGWKPALLWSPLCLGLIVAPLPAAAALPSTSADTALNPYSLIAVRNVFALRPFPVLHQERTTTAATNPLPEVTLSGIADFSLAQWVLLTVAEKGKPPKNYTLGLGEKQDGLEVLEIDAEAGTVKVRLQDAELSLNFKTHSTENESVRLAVQGRDFVQKFQPFVNEHTQAHAAREKHEQQRRDRERAEYLRAEKP